MFYTGLDPYTLKEVYSAKSPKDKAMQRALLRYFAPESHDLVEEALIKAHRTDLIGFGSGCLIKPSKKSTAMNSAKTTQNGRYSKDRYKNNNKPSAAGKKYGSKKNK